MERIKYRNFDALRLGLAVLVILAHSYLLAGRKPGDLIYDGTFGAYSYGHLAVDGFFCISGFLLAQSWLAEPRLGAYLWKRVLRIYPGFIVACLVCYFIVGPWSDHWPAEYFQTLHPSTITRHLLLLDDLTAPKVFLTVPKAGVLNGSLWTIRYEFLCYLLIPLLAGFGVLRHARAVLGMTLAVVLLNAWLTVSDWTAVYGTLQIQLVVQQMSVFLPGMAAYYYRDRLTGRNAALAAGGLLLVFYCAWFPAIFSPLLVPPIVLWAGTSPVVKLPAAARRGDFSYGVYLYAYPIQQLIIMYGVLTPWMIFALTLPLALGCAILSWHGVERPALRLRRLGQSQP